MILIGAIAIGCIAAFVLWNYIQNVKSDLEAGAEVVPVYVVSADVLKGTTGEDAQRTSIEVRQVPADIRPANAISDLNQIAGMVALNDLAANQVLVPGMFVDPLVARTSFADLITPGNVAYTFSVSAAKAVGGFVAPGDEVNMLISVGGTDLGEDDENATDGGEDNNIDNLLGSQGSNGDGRNEDDRIACFDCAINVTPHRYLYQRVKILAVGTSLTPQPGDAAEPDTGIAPTGGGSYTVLVPDEVAQLLASIDQGAITFTLLPEDYQATPLPPLDDDNFLILPGEDPERLTPWGPDGYIEGDESSEGTETGDDTPSADDPGSADAPDLGFDDPDDEN